MTVDEVNTQFTYLYSFFLTFWDPLWSFCLTAQLAVVAIFDAGYHGILHGLAHDLCHKNDRRYGIRHFAQLRKASGTAIFLTYQAFVS